MVLVWRFQADFYAICTLKKVICKAIDIHRNDGQRHRTTHSYIQLCMQKTKPITSLCQTKVPLHFDSVYVVGVGLLLFVRGHLPGSAQSRTGHPYAVCFTVRPVLAVSVYLINQNSFRIPSSAAAVSFDCIDENIAFIVCIEGQFF